MNDVPCHLIIAPNVELSSLNTSPRARTAALHLECQHQSAVNIGLKKQIDRQKFQAAARENGKQRVGLKGADSFP
jgi:hypothetical protein